MSENKKKIIDIFKNNNFKRKYSIKKVQLFGSVARGEDKKESDIDLLIDYEKPIDLVNYFSLKDDLERELGVKVDIINSKFLNNKIKKYIERDLITI